MAEDLPRESKLLLDVMLNMRPVRGVDELAETMELLQGKTGIEEWWDRLAQSHIIIQKDTEWLIGNLEQAKGVVSRFLEASGITAHAIAEFLESKVQEGTTLSLLIQALSQIHVWENWKSIIFTDGEWNGALGNLCEDLVLKRILFRNSWSSKKHSYRTYYVRTWPYDCEEIIRRIVLKHLNVEGLSNDQWRVISLLLFARNLELEYASLKENVPLTDIELREVVTNLRERGLITERYGKITLVQGLKTSLSEYFKVNFYPRSKAAILADIKQRVNRNISALLLVLTAKQIYELSEGEPSSEPVHCKIIARAQIKEFEQYVPDLKKIGIIFDFGNSVVVIADIVREVENWLRGSIRQSLVFIPAGDYYLARSTFQEIFANCDEYVKIQEPYIGEETFDILEYVPPDLKLQILTGIELSESEEPSDVLGRIEKMRAERGEKLQILFIGDKVSRKAPFHDRFILSKTRGWQVGTSLKQVGRGKDTTVSELSTTDKNERIEPPFDSWWHARDSALETQGLWKLIFPRWRDLFGTKSAGDTTH